MQSRAIHRLAQTAHSIWLAHTIALDHRSSFERPVRTRNDQEMKICDRVKGIVQAHSARP